ncbi:MAG: SUMF1/EgtB/PvdO family nonheme iron enzyme, partial [Myxococcales bacterium]|nr:SUMF1/EgtB/PvdO family nonheme iron enzyme [Myxococcales bacterium]
QPMSVAYQACALEPEEVRERLVSLGVSRKTQDMVCGLLQPDPAKRFQTPEDLLRVLDPDFRLPSMETAKPSAKAAQISGSEAEWQFSDTVSQLSFEDEPPEFLQVSRATTDEGVEPPRSRVFPLLIGFLLVVAGTGGLFAAGVIPMPFLQGTGEVAVPDAGGDEPTADVEETNHAANAIEGADGANLTLVSPGSPLRYTVLEGSRAVQVDPFYLDDSPIDASMWLRCVERGRCAASEAACDAAAEDNDWQTCVSWEQARTYCQSVGRRLPTEAEWVAATQFTRDGGLAFDNAAWEWVADWHASDYPLIASERNPTGPVVGFERVMRSRASEERRHAVPSAGSGEVLFRCAQSI